MPSGSMTSKSLSQLISKDFDEWFWDDYKRHPELWGEVFNVERSSDNYLRVGHVYTLGAMKDYPEGQGIPFDRFEQEYTKQVTFNRYGLAATVTEVMYDDDKSNRLKQIPKELAKSAVYTKELRAWDLFNNAFSGGESGLDGSQLCTSHTIPGTGGSFDNEVSGALGMSTLQAGIDKHNNMVNDRGIPVMSKPKVLVIPNGLRWKAKELLLSEYNPENANMGVNPLGNEEITFMTVPFLTSSTAWFLMSEKDAHDLRFIWRRDVQYRTYDDYNTEDAITKASMRMQVTFFDWRGVVGSTGT